MKDPRATGGGGGRRAGGLGPVARTVVLGVLAATAAYVVYSTSDQEPAQPPQASAIAQPSAATTASPSARAAPAPFARSEWGYRWDASKPGIAASPADAAWLESRGYPGPDVEDHLRRLSLQELEALDARGNQAATAIHAYRLATSGGPRDQVLALLSASANAGSAYALKTAGDIHIMVDGYRDPAMASAYYGLLARMGDHSGFEQRYLLSQQLDSTQRLQSDLMLERLWRDMSPAMQLSAGEEPRPGFDAFLDQGLGPKPGH